MNTLKKTRRTWTRMTSFIIIDLIKMDF
jgi:hypothetical protein